MSNFLDRSTVGGSVMNKVDKIVDLINRFLKNMGDDKVKIEDIEEVDAVRYYGDGSGLTGIGTGTGGVINEGSTTIGADSDDDGTGEIALQTKGVTRVRVKNDGTLETVGNAEIGGTLETVGNAEIGGTLETVGRVGIGTSTFSTEDTVLQLHSSGFARISVNSERTSGFVGGIVWNDGNGIRQGGVTTHIGDDTDNYMNFGDDDGTLARLRRNGNSFIDTGGNVGIGTTSPSDKLVVQTTAGKFSVKTRGATSVRLASSGYLNLSADGDDDLIEFDIGDNRRAILYGETGNLSIDGTLSEGSTARLKEDIQPLDDSLSTVLQLQPKRYHRKTTLEAEEQKEKGKRKREDIPKESGLIAEELIEIMPEAVTLDEDGEPAGIAYSMIIPVLANAIQELNAEIEKLKGEN